MKRSWVIIVVAFLTSLPATTFGWVHIYGEADKSEEGFSVRQTSDGGYIAVGYTRPKGNFETSDLWLLKTDSLGDTVWTKTYGGDYDDAGNCVRETSDGNYIITGSTQSDSADTYHNLWLIKADPAGDMIWSMCFDAGSPTSGACVEETDDGGYIVTGSPLTLLKTNSHGNLVWTRTYEGLRGHYVEQTADAGYIVTGYDNSSTWPDLWMLKTDSYGDSLWTQAYDTILWHEGECIRQTSDDGYIVAGWASDEMGGWSIGTQMWILRTDEYGDTLWTFLSDWEGGDEAKSVDVTEDGGYIVVGFRQEEGLGPEDLWLLKLNDEGDTLWTRTYGEENKMDVGYEVQQTEDGGYIITGYTSDDSSVNLWLIKTDELGYAYHYEVSPTTIVSPKEGDTLHNLTPEAYFANLGDPVSDFYCHCEVISSSYHGVPYHDSVWIEDSLPMQDSILVEFEEWTCEDSSSYEVNFYATKETTQPWSSEPSSSGFYGSAFSQVEEEVSAPHWEVNSCWGPKILLSFSGYPQGFHASIFDATGRRVDEIKSTSSTGILTWGERYRPGVYFIVPRTGRGSPRKVVLIR